MDKKKSFGGSLEAFFAGKGFYIVLFLCMAVIGVSAWAMFSGKRTHVDTVNADAGISLSMADAGTTGYGESVEIPQDVWSQDVGLEDPVKDVDANIDLESGSDLDLAVEGSTEADSDAQLVDGGNSTPPQTNGAVPVWSESVQSDSAPTLPADADQALETSASTGEIPSFFAWPVMGEVETAWCMTSLRYDRTMHDWRTHDGLDIAAELGSLVKATAPGDVIAVYADEMLGTTVEIAHEGGVHSIYASLQEIPTVSVGDHVIMGQVIGSVGDTALGESAEVSHLHFALTRDGESVDPMEYLP